LSNNGYAFNGTMEVERDLDFRRLHAESGIVQYGKFISLDRILSETLFEHLYRNHNIFS